MSKIETTTFDFASVLGIFTIFGFALGLFIALPPTNHDQQLIAQYKCVHVDHGKYLKIDGTKKCVISIDLAPSN